MASFMVINATPVITKTIPLTGRSDRIRKDPGGTRNLERDAEELLSFTFARAIHTALHCWIEIEACRRNRFPAIGAPAIGFRLDPLQCADNTRQFCFAKLLRGSVHGLLLQRVYTGDAPDTTLVQPHGIIVFFLFTGCRLQSFAPLQQCFPVPLDLFCIQHARISAQEIFV
jgi:hypothetical protein